MDLTFTSFEVVDSNGKVMMRNDINRVVELPIGLSDEEVIKYYKTACIEESIKHNKDVLFTNRYIQLENDFMEFFGIDKNNWDAGIELDTMLNRHGFGSNCLEYLATKWVENGIYPIKFPNVKESE